MSRTEHQQRGPLKTKLPDWLESVVGVIKEGRSKADSLLHSKSEYVFIYFFVPAFLLAFNVTAGVLPNSCVCFALLNCTDQTINTQQVDRDRVTVQYPVQTGSSLSVHTPACFPEHHYTLLMQYSMLLSTLDVFLHSRQISETWHGFNKVTHHIKNLNMCNCKH